MTKKEAPNFRKAESSGCCHICKYHVGCTPFIDCIKYVVFNFLIDSVEPSKDYVCDGFKQG